MRRSVMSWFVPVDNVAMMSTLCRWACVHVLRFVSAKCVTACTFYLAAFLSHRTYFGFLARSMSAGNHSSSSSLYNWDHLQKKETQKTSRFFVSPDDFLMGVMLDTGKIATMRLAPMAHISKVTNHCLACLVVAH